MVDVCWEATHAWDKILLLVDGRYIRAICFLANDLSTSLQTTSVQATLGYSEHAQGYDLGTSA